MHEVAHLQEKPHRFRIDWNAANVVYSIDGGGPDVWVGTGPRYPWGGLYGGQIVAQALRAAAHTVEGPTLPQPDPVGNIDEHWDLSLREIGGNAAFGGRAGGGAGGGGGAVTTKLMFALWDVEAAALHAPELHAVLAFIRDPGRIPPD